MPTIRATPLLLARLTLLGSGLLVASYMASYLPFPEPSHHQHFWAYLWTIHWEIALVSLPFLGGMAIVYWALRTLNRGIDTERWTEAQLEPARTFTASPVLTWITLLCIFLSVGLLFDRLLFHHHFGSSSAYILVWATLPVSQAKAKLRKPIKRDPRPNWTASTPIHSNHWGQPPTST